MVRTSRTLSSRGNTLGGRRFRQLLNVFLCVCGIGLSASAQSVIYVDGAATGANDGSSWTDAYASLEDALTAAMELNKPLEIRGAQGTYTPDSRDGFELLNGVTLRGGYVGVVGGDPDDRDTTSYATVLSVLSTGREIITGDRTDASAVVDGFTLRSTEYRNLGVSIADGSPTFLDCCFVSSGLRSSGFEAADCNSVLVNCRFEGHAGSAINCEDGHLTLRDCLFVLNEGEAIDMLGTLDLWRCSFLDNGQAVSCAGTLTAYDCTFADHHCDYSAAVSCSGDSTFVNCAFINNTSTAGDVGALAVGGGHAVLTRCLFQGNANLEWGSGAIESHFSITEISQCLFVGNTGGTVGGPTAVGIKAPGAISHFGPVLRVSNCTFADNRGWPTTIRYSPVSNAVGELTQCIVRDGTAPFRGELAVTYSNVEGGYEGEGNIDIDPGFVCPGYWNPNGTPDDPNDDIYVMGDYHLKSRAGHWDRDTQDWTDDEATSPCIDAGDPNGPIDAEPFPNGGFVNMGAYGGTTEASRSYFGTPVCETQIAGDINGDCLVDDLDLDILTAHWLIDATERANTPPTMRIISPEDGAELTEPTPIILRTEASDPDGIVIPMRYVMKHETRESSGGVALHIWEYADDWEYELGWANVLQDGTYEFWIEGFDDDGAWVTSERITVTLHLASTE